MKNKIAFIRPAPYPIPNRILPDVLAGVFPEYTVEIFDITGMLKAHPPAFLRNLLAMAWQYGPKLLRKHITRGEAFFTTTNLYSEVKRLIQAHIDPNQYVFTFQIQSLFDANSGVLPHFIFTDHTHLARLTYPGFDQRKMRSKRWIALERESYHRATLVFTRSSNISQSLIEQYELPPENAVCVGVGSNIIARDIDLDEERYANKHILFVGIDWERKGGPELVRAFRRILQSHPEARLTIVGASHPIDLPNCQVIGRIPVEEVSEYYRQASIFCLPTRFEPFGVVFIEALQHKLPIVATNVGAIPDFVTPGENGFLIEPGDVDALVQYLDVLLRDPELCREFGERGYQLVIDNYSWERVGEKMSAAIRGIIKNGHSEKN